METSHAGCVCRNNALVRFCGLIGSRFRPSGRWPGVGSRKRPFPWAQSERGGPEVKHFFARNPRSVIFGILTTAIPLLLGAAVGLWFGYHLLAALVIGSLLASHTLLA
jgi:hypothetical protein